MKKGRKILTKGEANNVYPKLVVKADGRKVAYREDDFTLGSGDFIIEADNNFESMYFKGEDATYFVKAAPLPIFEYNFSSFTTGLNMSNTWNHVGQATPEFSILDGNGSIFGGKVLSNGTWSASNSKQYLFIPNESFQDGQILALCKTTRHGSGYGFGLGMRYAASNNFIDVKSHNLGTQGLYNPGISSDTTSYAWEDNVWFWIRAQAFGSTAQMKIWKYSTNEPQNWMAELTGLPLVDGQWGVRTEHYYSTIYFDYVAYTKGTVNIPLPIA